MPNKKSALLFGLMTVVVIGLASALSFASKSSVETRAEGAKDIYFDFSKIDGFEEKEATPYIKFQGLEVPEAPLIKLEDGVFKSSEAIAIDQLTLDEKGFMVSLYDNGDNLLNQSGWIINPEFALDAYNYMSFIEEENALTVQGYGYYGDKKDNPGATYASQRVWLWANDELDDIHAVGYYSHGTWYVLKMDFYVNTDGNVYYYADIPYEVTSISFLNMSSNYLIDRKIDIKTLTHGVCYQPNEAAVSGYSFATVVGADASLLAKVVEAYLTYGKDPSNGAVEEVLEKVFTTWFKNKIATSDELKQAKILDYTGYSANGNSYVGLEKTSSFSVNEKWNAMCSQAGINPNTGAKRVGFIGSIFGSKTVMVGILGSAALVILLGLFGVLERKRRLK